MDKQLKDVGFSLADLRGAGYSTPELQDVGYGAEELRAAAEDEVSELRAMLESERARCAALQVELSAQEESMTASKALVRARLFTAVSPQADSGLGAGSVRCQPSVQIPAYILPECRIQTGTHCHATQIPESRDYRRKSQVLTEAQSSITQSTVRGAESSAI